jgi:DNA polymerase-3 subunit epsilon
VGRVRPSSACVTDDGTGHHRQRGGTTGPLPVAPRVRATVSDRPPTVHDMHAVQSTLDDLGTPLAGVTFVVVDLETTGGSPAECGITEIGAVCVRGGEVLGELQTLVNPREPIPAFISVLTGITDAMVRDAPRIEAALPAFLEFARGSVLVAHNAGFDVSFLKAACASADTPWPGFQVLDTVHLARQLVTREEAPNHRLATLARLFHASTTPSHRALEDARATVDVLHGLIERVGSLGVHTLEELGSYTSRVTPAQRRKRYLADDLPSAPGVYLFRDGAGDVLYVGTSVDIRTRVRSYFTASEQRSRMAEMVRLAERVTPIVCATTLEAEVRELRLIGEHKPRYNRRSRNPGRAHWVKLTEEVFPRLSIVRQVRDDLGVYVGPFASRTHAEDAVAAVHEVIPLRQCVQRLSPARRTSPCALADMGRCGAPCDGGQTVEEYAVVSDRVAQALSGDSRPLVAALRARLRELSDAERFEDARTVRDRMLALVRGAARAQRLAPLVSSPEIVAARRAQLGGWELVCVRHGRLAGSSRSPRGADPMPYVDALRASAEVVPPPAPGGQATSAEETEKVLRWLESPGVRLVSVDGSWTCPVGGAAAARAQLEPLHESRRSTPGFTVTS